MTFRSRFFRGDALAARITARRRSLALCETLEERRLFAFGVTTTTGSAASYVIDNGGDLKFSVLRPGATTSSTIHLGDVTSIKYKTKEVLAPYSTTSRYSHYEQGLGSIATVTTSTGGVVGSRWILVTADDSAESSGAVIQYYAVRENDNNIYMASLPIDVTNGPGEGRFIAYLERSVFTNPEAPSDNLGNDGAVEGSDVFHHPDGTTTSKFFNMGRRMIDNTYHGLTGTATGTPVGAWMFMGNREHSAGGPFFKDIDFQASDAVEIYNCIFTGHTQTESYRQGLHVYSMQFTNGAAPVTPDYSWMSTLNLQGWISAAQRGAISGTASGMVAGHQTVVGLSNSTAQYWTYANAGTGAYSITGVQPGTYTQTLYDNELEVGSKTVTISAGATTNANIANTFYVPANPIFRIGTWDGTPAGFLNADKISIMHPSDVRMTAWNSTPNFVVGTNTDAQWPMIEFMGVNNSQRITFDLTAAQVQNLTLRIGITLGFEGARPRVTVNAGQSYSWLSYIPTASVDLNSRGITRGTWRGDNQLYTYSIPSSALRAGTNTIDAGMVSGSYVAGQTWLSPNAVFDAIDLVPTSSASSPSIASVTVTPANSTVGVNGSKAFTAVAKDSSGNVIPANVDWSDVRGTVDPNGNYIAPATTGSDTITATATRTRTPGYSTTGSSSGSGSTTFVSSAITGTGNTLISVLDANPIVLTPATATPNPAYGTTANLSVLGNDDAGEANLTYTWSVIGTPPGSVGFSLNGSNAAKNTVATFGAYGSYDLLVTITDQQNHSITSQVTVINREHLARYKADETGGTTLADSSGGNNTANLTAPFSFVTGQFGNAVKLTGGYAALPTGIISTLNDFTVATWVRMDTLDATTTWSRIFDFGSSTTTYMFLTPRASGTNALRFAIKSSSGTEQQLNGPALTLNTWTHLAVTLSGNSATLYVNGSAVATNASMTTHPIALGSTTNNYIGKSQFPDPALPGTIDDFRIFGRAISAAEVSQLANPVRVTSQNFQYSTSEAVVLTFNRDVAPSIANTDLKIKNLDTGEFVPASSVQLNYSALTGTFNISPALDDGNYRATLPAASVNDSVGRNLGDAFTFDFFIMAGDTDHNRTVDVTDLGNLASSYGMTSGATWVNGDSNFDGKIDVTDLGNMASNYGTTLNPAGSAELQALPQTMIATATQRRTGTTATPPAATATFASNAAIESDIFEFDDLLTVTPHPHPADLVWRIMR